MSITSFILFSLTVFTITALIVSTLLCFASHSAHKEMTIKYSKCRIWGYGTFKKFIDQYNKIVWERDHEYPYSHFTKDESSEIHARVIKFNDMGMVLPFFEYIKFMLWERKNKYKSKSNNIW